MQLPHAYFKTKRIQILERQLVNMEDGNVYAVGDEPEEGIMVLHDFSYDGKVIKSKGHVPKVKDGMCRSKTTAKATREWYRGIMNDLFA